MAKPSDMPNAAVVAAVGDVDADGNTVVAEGFVTDDGQVIITEEMADTGLAPAAADPSSLYRTFTDSVIAIIGKPTSDRRILSQGIDLSFRTFPLPLMWCKQTGDGHMNSYTVGVLEDARLDGDLVMASGYMLNSPEADEAVDLISHGVTGPSVDLAAAEWTYTNGDGCEIAGEDLWDMSDNGDPVFTSFTKAELIGTTLVATPAFDGTRLTLNGDRETRSAALVASAAEEFRPRVYDHRLFDNPNLIGPTLPTMGDDGRIYGHLAVFGQCHRSIQTECVMVPRSPSDYSHFHTSPSVKLDNGSRLPVGRLTVGTGHADSRLSGGPALAHYDNTGSCFALVRVGEDSHGVWFSGVAAPWATAEQIEAGLSAPLSGDWRDFGMGLDLIAALAVNTPGFAARGRDDDQGRPVALVASVGPSRTLADRTHRMSVEDIKTAVFAALLEDRARAQADDEAVALAHSRDEALERVRTLVGSPPTPADQVRGLLAKLGRAVTGGQ